MSYHGDFWITTGAASPVILFAQALSAVRYGRLHGAIRYEIDRALTTWKQTRNMGLTALGSVVVTVLVLLVALLCQACTRDLLPPWLVIVVLAVAIAAPVMYLVGLEVGLPQAAKREGVTLPDY